MEGARGRGKTGVGGGWRGGDGDGEGGRKEDNRLEEERRRKKEMKPEKEWDRHRGTSRTCEHAASWLVRHQLNLLSPEPGWGVERLN